MMKYPEPGKVKTRLAQTIGPERAVACYRYMISTVLQYLQPLRSPDMNLIAGITGAPREGFQKWLPLIDDCWLQPEGELGHRLDEACRYGFSRGDRVLVIGTDCLTLFPSVVLDARDSLRHHDAVFGPTFDGGYYLVGTNRYLPSFFDNIPWSTADTLRRHQEHCLQQGWRYSLLPCFHDVDTWDDWLYYCQQVGRDPESYS